MLAQARLLQQKEEDLQMLAQCSLLLGKKEEDWQQMLAPGQFPQKKNLKTSANQCDTPH